MHNLPYAFSMGDEGEPIAIDWEDVHYFVFAARAQSLTGAARALGVQHTTVGRRIASLERTLGGALLRRGPGGIELTALGRRLLRHASVMDRQARAIGELARAERLTIRVVVPSGFTALLTPALDALGSAGGRIELEIASGARNVDLRNGGAHLAVRVGPVEDDRLIARKLCEAGWALYASRSYLARQRDPVRVEDLSGHSIIGFHASLARLPAAAWLAARAQGGKIVMRCRDAVDMVAAARSGAGLAVLPCFLAEEESLLVRITPEPIASRPVSLVYRREARLSPELQAVSRLIVNVMRKNAAKFRGTNTTRPGA